MVNDLRDLLSSASSSPPPDALEVHALLAAGRRRVRRRRVAALGGTALGTAALVTTASLVALGGGPADLPAAGVPHPSGPVLRLTDAARAVEGTDYRVLAAHTDENLDLDNGQYFEGVTDDGLVLFRDGPREGQWWPRFALLDPATGAKDWLPRLDIGQTQTWPLALDEDRLLLLAVDGGMEAGPDATEVGIVVHVFDRATRQWSELRWPDLPAVEDPFGMPVGPDGRFYVRVPANIAQPPEGGWPIGPGGEAEDADADGSTYHLWSASLSDPSDVRDEGLTVGSVAFGEHTMVWTDSTGGDAGRVHVRDLRTGEEHAFDPRTGERCNLLGFGATDERVVMSQYCGTYDGQVRDDRVQVLTTDGDPVVTVQDDSIEGDLASAAGAGVVTLWSHGLRGEGTYVYDLATDRFLRVSTGASRWEVPSGPTLEDQFFYDTPKGRHGRVQHLAELVE